MVTGEGIDDAGTLAEIRRTQRRVRSAGRRVMWVWLIIGLGGSGFAVFAPPVTHGWLQQLVTAGFMLIAIGTVLYALRQQVVGLAAARLQWPVTTAYAALIVVDAVFRIAADPTRLSTAVVVLGCLPAVPCLYGAWRVWGE